jgi:hypothetical protein
LLILIFIKHYMFIICVHYLVHCVIYNKSVLFSFLHVTSVVYLFSQWSSWRTEILSVMAKSQSVIFCSVLSGPLLRLSENIRKVWRYQRIK